MKRRDVSLTVALSVSLAAHAMLLLGLAEHYALTIGEHLWLAGHPDQAETPAAIYLPQADRRGSAFGESTGLGDALNASEGETPLEARDSDHSQAFLSLDPIGVGRIGDAPSPSALPPGAAAPPPPRAFGLPAGMASSTLPARKPPLPSAVLQRSLQSAREAPEDPRNERLAAAPAGPTAPSINAVAYPPAGGTASPADPAPQGDSESDPFKKNGSFEFRNGELIARFGRKVKTVRPRLTIAGQMDLIGKASRTVILKVKIDEHGKVRLVEVARSSGSNEVDQPCRVAVYQWEFEPSRNAAGDPVPDVLMIPIVFR